MISNLNQYQNTQVGTASPERILIMLYDGAINFTRLALDKMNKGDLAGKGRFVSKSQAIVSELMNTLNHEVGGEIAGNLERLYTYIIDELLRANIENSPLALENVLKILGVLRETWIEAIEKAKQERMGAAGHAAQPLAYAAGGM